MTMQPSMSAVMHTRHIKLLYYVWISIPQEDIHDIQNDCLRWSGDVTDHFAMTGLRMLPRSILSWGALVMRERKAATMDNTPIMVKVVW